MPGRRDGQQPCWTFRRFVNNHLSLGIFHQRKDRFFIDGQRPRLHGSQGEAAIAGMRLANLRRDVFQRRIHHAPVVVGQNDDDGDFHPFRFADRGRSLGKALRRTTKPRNRCVNKADTTGNPSSTKYPIASSRQGAFSSSAWASTGSGPLPRPCATSGSARVKVISPGSASNSGPLTGALPHYQNLSHSAPPDAEDDFDFIRRGHGKRFQFQFAARPVVWLWQAAPPVFPPTRPGWVSAGRHRAPEQPARRRTTAITTAAAVASRAATKPRRRPAIAGR